MADKDQCTLIVQQHVFQQIERLHVEIIGRFVHDQEVRSLGETDGEGEPVALSA